jgi:hypothetical protein
VVHAPDGPGSGGLAAWQLPAITAVTAPGDLPGGDRAAPGRRCLALGPVHRTSGGGHGAAAADLGAVGAAGHAPSDHHDGRTRVRRFLRDHLRAGGTRHADRPGAGALVVLAMFLVETTSGDGSGGPRNRRGGPRLPGLPRLPRTPVTADRVSGRVGRTAGERPARGGFDQGTASGWWPGGVRVVAGETTGAGRPGRDAEATTTRPGAPGRREPEPSLAGRSEFERVEQSRHVGRGGVALATFDPAVVGLGDACFPGQLVLGDVQARERSGGLPHAFRR